MATNWTEDKQNLIKVYLEQGMTYAEIGKILKTSPDSIKHAVVRYDLRNGNESLFPKNKNKLKREDVSRLAVLIGEEIYKNYKIQKIEEPNPIKNKFKKEEHSILDISDVHIGMKNEVYDSKAGKRIITYNGDIFKKELNILQKAIFDIHAIQSSAYNLRELHINFLGDVCVPPKTLIMTKEGLRYIEDIKEGDYVLTHKNRYKKVIRTMNREVKENIQSISSCRIKDEILLTKNHPVWTIKKYFKQYKNINTEPNFVPASDINNSNWTINRKNSEGFKPIEKVYFDKISRYDTVSNNDLVSETEVDSDFLTVVGLFLGDGNSKVNNKRGSISFALGRTKKDKIAIEILTRWSKKIGCQLKNIQLKTKKMGVFYIHCKPLAVFFRQFYDQNKQKTLPLEWLNVPIEQLKYIIYGFILSDGYVEHRTIGSTVRITNTSLKLLQNIKIRLEFDGIFCCLSYGNEKRRTTTFVNGDKTYISHCKLAGEMSLCNKTCMPILELLNINNTGRQVSKWVRTVFDYIVKDTVVSEDKYYEGTVYNLEVEDDNTYIANGFILHNCTNDRIFPEQTSEIDKCVGLQIWDAVNYFSQFFLNLLKLYEKITVVGVVGNHGRSSDLYEEPVENNYEYNLYRIWQKQFENSKRIKIIVPNTRRYIHNICGWKHMMEHGDAIRGFAEASIIKQIKELHLNAGGFDIFHMGHIHQIKELEIADKVVAKINGAWIPKDNYAWKNFKSYSVPKQHFFGCNEKRPETWTWKIDLRG